MCHFFMKIKACIIQSFCFSYRIILVKAFVLVTVSFLKADALTKAADALTRGCGRFDPDALALGRFDYTP